jgi:threonine dehydratase
MNANPEGMSELPALADVEAARARIVGQVSMTPCLQSRTLSDIVGAVLHLKFENLQFTASFKERGALNKLLTLPDTARRKGVVTVSAGNHAQAVAYHASRLNIPATIIMPKPTPTVKVTNVRRFGAEVILHGNTFQEASAHLDTLMVERGLTLVHPFDDREVTAGQGTLVLEMLEQIGEFDDLVIPIGGGGMIAGCALALKAKAPHVRLIGVQSARYPSMALQLGRWQGTPPGGLSIAEGIAVAKPGAIPSRILEHHLDEMIVVEEERIEQAVALLLEIEKTVTEGAGATGVAALLARPDMFKGRRVATVLCGGNIDTRLLVTILQHALVRQGRLIRLKVGSPDLAGALGHIASLIGQHGGNIVDVQHERAFSRMGANRVGVVFDLELRNADDSRIILAALHEAGYEAETVTA